VPTSRKGRVDARVIALGDVSFTRKEITMTHTRFAFVKANWHADIVGKALKGFIEIIPTQQVDVFDVPGAFELPLVARDLANSGKCGRSACRRWRNLSA